MDCVAFRAEGNGMLGLVATSVRIVLMVLSVVFNDSNSDVKFKDEQPSMDTGNVFGWGALAEAPKLIQAARPMEPIKPITTPCKKI